MEEGLDLCRGAVKGGEMVEIRYWRHTAALSQASLGKIPAWNRSSAVESEAGAGPGEA